MELLRGHWRDVAPTVRVHIYNGLCTCSLYYKPWKTLHGGANTIFRCQSIQALYGALSELAQRPEYIDPLREEAEAFLENREPTVAICDQMILMDSFLKECQRLHPPAASMSI
jgi:hypothetical protein